MCSLAAENVIKHTTANEAGLLSGTNQGLYSGVAGSSLCRNTELELVRGFPQSVQENDAIVTSLGSDRFLSNPFQFISHPSNGIDPGTV